MDRLLLYHDFVSPFCRLAAQVAREAADRSGLTLRVVPFELVPAPAPLLSPEELDPEERETARSVAEEWGLELGTLPRVPRTRKAHEAVAFAREQEAELAMVWAVYDALWRDGRDISRLDVLAETGEAVGLDPESLHVALGTDRLEGPVTREQQAAATAGLTGVPAIQLGDVVAVGLFPAGELVGWIEAHRKRSSREPGSGGGQ